MANNKLRVGLVGLGFGAEFTRQSNAAPRSGSLSRLAPFGAN